MDINRNILLIDDEDKLRSLLNRTLSLEGYALEEAKDLKSARKKLSQGTFRVILCDVKLPDGSGVDFVKEVKRDHPESEIIVLTAFGNIPDGVLATRYGAFNYLVKGDDNEKIIPLVSLAMDKALLQWEVKRRKEQSEKATFPSIIGHSTKIREAIALARKVSGTNTTVLLTGETGTGKEVFAHAIHQESARGSKNFVAINCSTFSKEILETELFGYKAGAFTGALKDKRGLFEEANEGTIFLDEIGEVPLELQAKLLRVLETGTFIKVGDTKEIKVDVRIIAATNRDLLSETALGGFRLDLYYRLSVFQIQLPSLSERIDDIPLLADYFLRYFSESVTAKALSMAPDFMKALQLHHWKGNIRELRNVIERAVILTEGDELTLDTLPLEFNMHQNHGIVGTFEMAVIEKHHIQKVLAHTKGNKTEAARLLNIGLTTLYRKVEEYGL